MIHSNDLWKSVEIVQEKSPARSIVAAGRRKLPMNISNERPN